MLDKLQIRFVMYWKTQNFITLVLIQFNFMRLLFLALIAVFFANKISAQKVFSVQYSSQADVKVFLVNYESQADLLIYKVKYDSQAGDNNGKWFFTQYESQAKKKIFCVDYESQADLKIFFVDYESRAGWKNSAKKQLMY